MSSGAYGSPFASVDPKEAQLDDLLEQVLNRHLQPEDKYEIAAILESLGWNDDRVRETFGVHDIFALATDLWNRSRTKVSFSPFSKVEEMSPSQLIMSLVRNFLRGVIFALPMAVSVLSMLTLKFSLWSYENLSVELATSIAIGTILSFVTVGGFTQAIARRGFFYIIQGYYNMARRVTFHLIGLGFLLCVVLCLFLFGINLIIEIFPYSMLSISILYFFFLNTIWLSVTVMYILKKELVFTGLIIIGIGIVFFFFEVLDWGIILSQLIALSVVSVLSIFLVIYYFKEAERKEEKGISPKLPKMSVMLYSTMPYFVYGFLYFAFLFVDRVMAWSTNSGYMPYLIWFRGNYELGLDFALLVLILPMGISEVVLNKLMIDIEKSQKSYWGDETGVMNRTYLRVYYNRLGLIAVVSVISAVLLYVSVKWALTYFSVPMGDTLFNNAVTHFVFVVSLIAYVLVAVALMNAVILFSLSQPELVVRSVWPAMLVNLGVGFLCSRWFEAIYPEHGYSFAVYGLLSGSIVFMVLSTKQVRRVLGKLDYYLYAAS
jgi:hypothetical protein